MTLNSIIVHSRGGGREEEDEGEEGEEESGRRVIYVPRSYATLLRLRKISVEKSPSVFLAFSNEEKEARKTAH